MEASGAARRRSLDVHLPNRLGVTPLVPLSLPLPHFSTLVDPTSAPTGPCVKDRPRKTIDRLMWRVALCAARGSRLAPRDRVRAYVCGSRCPVLKGRGQFLSFRCGVGRSLHRRGKKFPAGSSSMFEKDVFLSIDCPHICSPRPFLPSHLRLPSLMVRVRKLGSS